MNRCVAAGLLAAVALPASAQTTFFATSGTVLYRTTLGGAIESWDLGIEMIGMAVTPNGRIYVQQDNDRSSGDPISRLWSLDAAFSATPVLTLLTDDLSRHHTNIAAFDNNTLYGTKNGTSGRFDRIDLTPPIDDVALANNTVLGSLGGSAIDRSTGTMYLLDNDVSPAVPGATNSLYTVDSLTPAGPELGSTLVGGLNVQSISSGMEWFDGTLYAAIQNGTSGDYEIGFINPATAEYTLLKTLVPGGASRGSTALAVLPAPGSVLALAGFAAMRRRR